MAYTINSAKDSQGNEQDFLDAFNQNLPAIAAYKQQHGGDLEGAFQAVTGTPWPAGRSVKLKGGAGEMTKDRTVKSVLGKYVAPIGAAAATAFVPGLAPTLGHALGIGGGSGTVPGFGIPSGLTAASEGVNLAAPAASGLMSTVGKYAAGKAVPALMQAAGAGLAGNAKDAAANRGVGLEAGDTQEQLRQSGRALDINERSDAWKKLNQAAYVQQYGGYKPATLNMGSAGTNALPDFGLASGASSEAQLAGSAGLQAEVLKRLQGGAPAPYTQDPKLLKPGLMEKIGNIAGPALTAGSSFYRPRTT